MWNKRIALIAGSVAVAVAGGAPTVAAGAADERAGCLGSLSSFGGPNHLRAPIQHFLTARRRRTSDRILLAPSSRSASSDGGAADEP
jgi:hypothetical protein